MRTLTLFAVLFIATSLFSQKFHGLALTPPMGWNSWNKFACDVNETLIRETADAMVTSGLKKKSVSFPWKKHKVSDTFSKKAINVEKNTFQISDVWAKKNIGTTKKSFISKVSSHDVIFLRGFWDSVGDSVWDSVRDSVWDSFYAFIGSFFQLKKSKWKYTKKIKCKGYPFQSAVDLWMEGLVPIYDGKRWSLVGKRKGKIKKLYEVGVKK